MDIYTGRLKKYTYLYLWYHKCKWYHKYIYIYMVSYRIYIYDLNMVSYLVFMVSYILFWRFYSPYSWYSLRSSGDPFTLYCREWLTQPARQTEMERKKKWYIYIIVCIVVCQRWILAGNVGCQLSELGFFAPGWLLQGYEEARKYWSCCSMWGFLINWRFFNTLGTYCPCF